MPELTARQLEIRDDYMKYFHQAYAGRFGAVARFSHGYPLRTAFEGARTLDVGAGIGEHLNHEPQASESYIAMELRPEMAAVIRQSHPEVTIIVGDVQARIELLDESVDRVIAIHVLEHLPNLPAALDEVRRVLRPGGVLAVVIPCEGGFGYALGRYFTTRRIFEKRYQTSYDWCIKSEHVNVPSEILAELDMRFHREHCEYFPLRLPTVHVNLCIGLTYRRN